MSNQEQIITTGVYKEINDQKFFQDIGVTRGHAKYWGAKEEDIKDLIFVVSEDQSEPKWNEQEYWGWYDYERARWDMIYPNYKLFNCCFPYGVQSAIDANKGRAYRLELLKIN